VTKEFAFHEAVKRLSSEEPWAITIVPARYNGIYEGGRWLAFPVVYDVIPDDVYGNDVRCMGWFSAHANVPIGRGTTPNEAHDELLRRLRDGLKGCDKCGGLNGHSGACIENADT